LSKQASEAEFPVFVKVYVFP